MAISYMCQGISVLLPQASHGIYVACHHSIDGLARRPAELSFRNEILDDSSKWKDYCSNTTSL